MPRTTAQVRRELYVGAGDAWTMVAEMVTATGVWAAIGYGLDRAFGTWPALFAIGAIVGNATGVYILYRRTLGARPSGAKSRTEKATGERNDER